MSRIDPETDATPAAEATAEPVDLSKLTDEQLIEKLADKAILGSRQYFAHFRKYVDRTMIENWRTLEVSNHLQQFYDDIIAGKRPKLVIMTPPQHGKSRGGGRFYAPD